MALKNCTECGKQVSSNAKSCPNCGSPVKGSGTATSIARIMLMLFAFISFVPALLSLGPIGLIIPAVLFIMALCLK